MSIDEFGILGASRVMQQLVEVPGLEHLPLGQREARSGGGLAQDGVVVSGSPVAAQAEPDVERSAAHHAEGGERAVPLARRSGQRSRPQPDASAPVAERPGVAALAESEARNDREPESSSVEEVREDPADDTGAPQ